MVIQTIDLSTIRNRINNASDQSYEPNREVGKPSLRRFIVAVKRLTGSWPTSASKVISEARHKYDAGTHIMCSGVCRKNRMTILYLWKRKRSVKPINYFYPEEDNV